eukprot:evm.model.scf_32EXC.5 EVM.evm.TU.scf_32EXC.5   scf_32EXC:129448-132375(-)
MAELLLCAGDLYKGDAGRVGVVGGCREYTGAPYFAAFSALRLGADLSHVFCSQKAAQVIKCYSPELIVHPYLLESEDGKEQNTESAVLEVARWFSRLDCLVVGPGLGRDPVNLRCARDIMAAARQSNLPMVIDADGLYLVNREPDLVKGYDRAILTPNLNELRRLAEACGAEGAVDILRGEEQAEKRRAVVSTVGAALGGPVVVSKGAWDIISSGRQHTICDLQSSSRRCGGQGDVLAGALAVFVSWAVGALARTNGDPHLKQSGSVGFPESKGWGEVLLAAAFGACAVTRKAAATAFASRRRSMIAGDVIGALGEALEGFEQL